MKKRIEGLMLLTLIAFLFSGLTSLHAQSFTTGPVEYAGVDGKTIINYQESSEALATVTDEITSNYPTINLPVPTTESTAENYYQLAYLLKVRAHLGNGKTTASSVYRGYNEVTNMAKGSWPDLIDEAWMNNMTSLLSN